jgi:hypothetical protein
LKSRRSALKKKIAGLEEARRNHRQDPPHKCNCREATYYHIPDELQAILEAQSVVPCPVHGARDLGRIRWQFDDSLSLLPEDQRYCCCPPNSHRDYAEGRRTDPPTREDREADFVALLDYFGDSQARFAEDRSRAELMTSAYYAKRNALLSEQTSAKRRVEDFVSQR